MQRSLNFIGRVINTLNEKLIPSGMSAAGAQFVKVETFIRNGMVGGRTQSEVTRALQDLKERDTILGTLVNGNKIICVDRPTAGRSVRIFFHERWLEEHKTKFPDDRIH